MGQLQYIASTNGSFNSVLAQNVTQDSIIEAKFLSTDYSTIIYFGDIGADVLVRHWYGTDDMYWYNGGGFQIASYWTLNEEHTVSFSTSEYKFDEHTFSVTGTCNIPASPKFTPNVNGRLYYFTITTNDVVTVNLVAWDENGVLGMKDLVSGNFYQPSSGTWTAGPPYVPPTPTVTSKIYLGSTNLGTGKIRLGANDVSAIYLGANQIYPPLGPIDYFRIVNVDSVSGDITFPQNATNLEYNIDGGAWVNPSTSSVTITLQPNEVLNMRAKSGTTFTIGSSVMTCTFMFDVEGNLATLINGQNPDSVTTLPSDYCRGWFRGQTKIRYADKLHLGTITTVGHNSMYFMFRESSLVKGMDLSNITTFSANNGISTIYYGCTSLTEVTAPSIISTDGNMHRWLDSVSASGNCICPNAYVYNNLPTYSSTTDYGIPSGWTKSYDCRNWENEGYEDKGHCDCEFNYAAEGYSDEYECLCTEFQECTVETPTISFENGVYQDVCQKFNGNGTVTITCPQSGVVIYYRYVTQTCVNNVPTFADITQESWNVYSNAITLTNYKSCGSTNGQYKIQAKATKSGMDDSLIAESVVTVNSDQGPCNCTDDFNIMGYISEGECYCTESGDNMGYETIEDCMCNEYQECPEP